MSVRRVFSGSPRKNWKKNSFRLETRAARCDDRTGRRYAGTPTPGAWPPGNLVTRSKVHHSLYAFYWVGRGGDFHFSTSVLTSACILLPFLPRACPQHCVGPGKTPAGCDDFFTVYWEAGKYSDDELLSNLSQVWPSYCGPTPQDRCSSPAPRGLFPLE